MKIYYKTVYNLPYRCYIKLSCIFAIHSMISKAFKLTSKDIRYMSYKSHKRRSEFGTLMVIKQYPNKSHHQIGVAISTKLSKSSVKRNLIKRILYTLLYDRIDTLLHGNKYVKCFFVINNQHQQLHNLLHETSGKEYAKIHTYCQHYIMQSSFNYMFNSCIQSLDTSNFD